MGSATQADRAISFCERWRAELRRTSRSIGKQAIELCRISPELLETGTERSDERDQHVGQSRLERAESSAGKAA